MVDGVDLGIDGLSDYRKIGSGGFATVYAAKDHHFGRTVAVKVLQDLEEAGLRRFERERLSMGRAEAHPNVVTPLGSGYTQPDRRPYVTMEYLDGGSLEDLIRRGGPVDWRQAASYLTPIAGALGHAHDAGLLHRDVKPANILLSGSGLVKLADFGIAAIREATTTTALAFTLAHSPPETFAGGNDTRDERSDLYSLASCLFALVVGRPPFESGDHAQLAYIMRIASDPLPSTGVDVLDRFLEKAMAKSPDARFQTAEEFAGELESIRSGRQPTEAAYAESPGQKATVPRSATTIPVSLDATTPSSVLRHSSRVGDIAVLGDGRIATATEDPAVRLWELAGPRSFDVDLPSPAVRLVALTGSRLAAATVGGAIVVKDLTSEAVAETRSVHVLEPHHGSVSALVSTPDGRLVVGTRLGLIVVVMADGSGTVMRDALHSSGVTAVAAWADGIVASGDRDGNVIVWSLDEPHWQPVAPRVHDGPVSALVALPDQRLASCGLDGWVHVGGRVPDRPATALRYAATPYALTARPDGQLAIGGSDGLVAIWDPHRPTVAPTALARRQSPIWSLAVVGTGIASAAGSEVIVTAQGREGGKAPG